VTVESHNSGKKYPHIVLVRAPGLLPMQNKVKELAEELGVPSRTLRDWLNHGMPRKGMGISVIP
jgi:hypothetical protein